MAGPMEEGSCRWKYKKGGGLGSKSFCSACKEQDDLSATNLRLKIKSGLIKLDGACIAKKRETTEEDEAIEAAILASTRGRSRGGGDRYEASATGKTNKERSNKPRKKRRKSIEDARKAESVLKQEIRKQKEGKEMKPNLLRSTLAFVSGKENVVIPNKRKSGVNGTDTASNKAVSKATKYRHLQAGASVINGATRLLSINKNANKYREDVMRASLKTNLVDTQPTPTATSADNNRRANDLNAAAFAKELEEKKVEKREDGVKSKMCETFVDAMKLHGNPEARRPYLACFTSSKKPDIERLINANISEYEWNKARIHARWPGPLKKEPKIERSRQRIPATLIKRFLHFLEQPGNLQRYAFGTRLLAITKGKGVRELESIDCLKKVQQLAVDFILSMDSELVATEEVGDLPVDTCRCAKLERDTHRRCMLQRNHDGINCKFTAKGSMSRTTAIKLVKTLTGGEIKKLSGLDDAKVLKGRDNFQSMRDLTEILLQYDQAEKKEVLESINDAEVFYQTDYVDHLKRHSDQVCNCLSCGFSTDKEKLCPNHGSHKAACVECAAPFAVISRLSEFLSEKTAAAAANANANSLRLQQHLGEYAYNIDTMASNLKEYRSHLARHKSEAEFDTTETAELGDDTAIVVSDWKMKILACFFRENQAKWFGKRGTSCIGFMIISNSTDPAVREKGLKEVQFIMMFTDDTKQDDHSVACAKAEIYQHHLPQHVSKVIFRADGAGCFKSSYHRGIQAHWGTWTGIERLLNFERLSNCSFRSRLSCSCR